MDVIPDPIVTPESIVMPESIEMPESIVILSEAKNLIKILRRGASQDDKGKKSQDDIFELLDFEELDYIKGQKQGTKLCQRIRKSKK